MNILEARRRLLDGEIKKRTAEGENISVRSVSRMRPALTLYGKSEQETTTGAQLLKDTYLDNVTGAKDVFNSDGEIIIPQGISTNKEYNILFSDISDILTQMQDDDAIYICIRLIKKINQSEFNYQIAFKNAENINIINTFNDNIKQTTYSTLKNSRRIQCYFYNNNQSVDISGNVFQMIISRDENCIYEPYTGGQPSPSPDYPQEIKSVGDSGEINVRIVGAQLFDASSINPETVHVNNISRNSILIVAEIIKFTSDADGDVYIGEVQGNLSNIIQVDVEPNIQYTITISDNRLQKSMIRYIDSENEFIGSSIQTGTQYTFTTPEKCVKIALRLGDENSVSGTQYETTVMLHKGSTALPWEPYRIPQTLPVQTPNGLPGIPVSSGGNYTDADGQQWICDEVDFERGVYVQRVHVINAKNRSWNDSWNLVFPDETGKTHVFNVSTMEYAISQHAMSNVFFNRDIDNSANVNVFTTDQGNGGIGVRVYSQLASTLEEWNAYINSHDVIFALALKEQNYVETPLSTSELAAYAALRTYSPTTVVTNDAGAWMKLGYKTKKSLEVTD